MEKKEIITGNYYDKYKTKKIIEKFLVNRYKVNLLQTINELEVSSCYEVGSGEGYILKLIEETFAFEKIVGSDIDIQLLKSNYSTKKTTIKIVNDANFLPFTAKEIDLILSCEVLEHLFDPHSFLEECARINAKFYLFTVPNEPLWRVLNMFRFKYIKDFGNTPGHINHWSKKQFFRLVSSYLDVKKIFIVQPWLFLLAQPKQ